MKMPSLTEDITRLKTAFSRMDIRSLFFSSSETLLIFILVAKAVEFCYMHNTRDTLSSAVFEVGHIPLKVHGILLLIACFTHLIAVRYGYWRIRAGMLFAETIFFLFNWFALILAASEIPFSGMLGFPVVIIFSVGNLLNVVLWRHKA